MSVSVYTGVAHDLLERGPVGSPGSYPRVVPFASRARAGRRGPSNEEDEGEDRSRVVDKPLQEQNTGPAIKVRQVSDIRSDRSGRGSLESGKFSYSNSQDR